MKNALLCFFILASISTALKAESQEAHVHGLATLKLAFENDILEIQFESPAANIVGFEHEAHSSEEKQAVAKSEQALNSPQELFSFTGADCTPTVTKVDVSGVLDREHDEDEEHHNHGKHEEHDSEHHDEDSHEGEHSEITASYQFRCQNSEDLSAVVINLFKPFPAIEKINAMWVSESGQGANTLKPNENTLSLR